MRYSVTFYLFLFVLLAIIVGWSASLPRSSPVVSLFSQKQTTSVMGLAKVPSPTPSITIIVKVITGDTVVTNEGRKIRYIGVKAPELSEPFGTQAASANTQLILGKQVQIVFDTQTTDKEGEELAYVFVQNKLVNGELVKNGLADVETVAPNLLHQNELIQDEQIAKNQCVGMWQSYCVAGTPPCVKITTVHFGDTVNLNDEWVLLQNSCNQTINLKDWFLKNASSSNIYIFKNNTINPSQTLTLHSGCGSDSATDIYWKCPEIAHTIWNNNGEEPMLFDSSGELLSVYK